MSVAGASVAGASGGSSSGSGSCTTTASTTAGTSGTGAPLSDAVETARKVTPKTTAAIPTVATAQT